MKTLLTPLIALATIGAAPVPKPALAPSEIVAAAPASDWEAIAPADLLVMTLGNGKRVVIQLMPPPFSQGWIGNIRKLAAAHFWDGTSINRVQDNYVVQWGDASEKKALPVGLVTVGESGYSANYGLAAVSQWIAYDRFASDREASERLVDDAAFRAKGEKINAESKRDPAGYTTPIVQNAQADGRRPLANLEEWRLKPDAYSRRTGIWQGWAIASDQKQVWPVHCYGMVGVGRNLSPDTGSGAELYTVIGHAPRHLDRNIAVVGRVIAGIENLSSLPRGTGALGIYEKPEERVAITSIRLASELPATEQPRFEYLSTESKSFAAYADARANRRDPFFIRPAGGADICNIPVPVRKKP